MVRRLFLRTWLRISRTFSSWSGAVLAGPSRRPAALFFGIAVAAIGAVLFACRGAAETPGGKLACDILGAFLTSLGASIVAAALVETYFEHRNPIEKHIRDTGIRFIGDRKLFDAVRMRGNRLGWDAWIQETRGQLLVVGRQNGHWIDSADSLKSLLDREGTIEFVFMGSQDDVGKWIDDFQRKWMEKFGGQFPSPDKVQLRACIAGTVPDSGYYWNGRELLVKVYVPGQPKPDCPIIGFDASGAGGSFDIADFDPDKVPYQQAQALIQAANGLNRLISEARRGSPVPAAQK